MSLIGYSLRCCVRGKWAVVASRDKSRESQGAFFSTKATDFNHIRRIRGQHSACVVPTMFVYSLLAHLLPLHYSGAPLDAAHNHNKIAAANRNTIDAPNVTHCSARICRHVAARHHAPKISPIVNNHSAIHCPAFISPPSLPVNAAPAVLYQSVAWLSVSRRQETRLLLDANAAEQKH